MPFCTILVLYYFFIEEESTVSFLQSTKSLAITALIIGLVIPSLASSDTLEERIKPVGETCMEGDSCAAAVAAPVGGSSVARDGETVYSTKCSACHSTGAAGAPKLGDAAAWSTRFDARGLEGLYSSGLNGFNGMPPKGACADCSDDEIKAAVDHMLANSK